jgi:hypothetical protein
MGAAFRRTHLKSVLQTPDEVRRDMRLFATSLVFVWAALPVRAGLHYSGEPIAELPSQWRGYLTDLRAVRNIAVKPTASLPASPLRTQYEAEAKRLAEAAKTRKLTADEIADLGALWIRLGEIEKALEVLRTGEREHPQRYAIISNLGTAWQLYGDLERAADCLRQAVILAPGKLQKAEELHLRLLRSRLREAKGNQDLDPLFEIQFVGESGQWEPGKLAGAQRKKLPGEAVALVQQLCLWMPADARLLWQLGELANAHGDVKIAAELFESCVGQFGLSAPALREHRSLAREAVAALDKRELPGPATAKAEHAGHAPAIAPRSKRPLNLKRLDASTLPAISKDAVNNMPWALLQETNIDRNFRPAFAKYLQELNEHQVSLTGFMQPLTDDLELSAFMLIEYPIGCWYCEVPEVTSIVLVELPEGKSVQFTRNLVKVTGRLRLNSKDPEDFLYTIKGSKVTEAD